MTTTWLPPATPRRPAAEPNTEAIEAARRRARLEERIHFDFDRADLSSGAMHILSVKSDIMRRETAVRLRIEGHADERGSDEYNLALGNRRAAAAKRYLVQQGINPDRLEVASYGEEQPVDTGHNEAAWAANRRGEFRVMTSISGR